MFILPKYTIITQKNIYKILNEIKQTIDSYADCKHRTPNPFYDNLC